MKFLASILIASFCLARGATSYLASDDLGNVYEVFSQDSYEYDADGIEYDIYGSQPQEQSAPQQLNMANQYSANFPTGSELQMPQALQQQSWESALPLQQQPFQQPLQQPFQQPLQQPLNEQSWEASQQSWGMQQQPLMQSGFNLRSGKKQQAVQAPQTIQLPSQTLPVQEMILPELKAEDIRSTSPLQERSAGYTRATPIYNQPVVTTRVFERNLIQPIVQNQLIRQKHYISQPIVTRRIIEQPIVQPLVTQNVVRTRVTPQPIVRQRLLVQPVIQQRVIEAPHVKSRLVNKPMESQPIQETYQGQPMQAITEAPRSAETAQPIQQSPIFESVPATQGSFQPIQSTKKQ